jgi:hypothetical protein
MYHSGGMRRDTYKAMDIRWEPNAWMYLKVPRDDTPDILNRWFHGIHKFVPDVSTYVHLIETFLYGTDFVASIRRMYGSKAPLALVSLVPRITDERPNKVLHVHPIAHEYHSLSPEHSAMVRAFLDARIKDVAAIMRDDLGYDHLARIIARRRTSRTRAIAQSALLDIIRESRMSTYKPSLLLVARFVTPVILMDAYLLCNLLNTLRDEESDGIGSEKEKEKEKRLRDRDRDRGRVRAMGEELPVSRLLRQRVLLVYAGNSHIESYVHFFENYMGLVPLVDIPASSERGRSSTDNDTPDYGPGIEFSRHVDVDYSALDALVDDSV